MQNIIGNQWLEKSAAWVDSVDFLIDVALHALPRFLLFSVCGFIFGVIFTIYLAKNRLLKRNQPFWNVLAKFSYVLILLIIPLALGAIGGIQSVQGLINQKMDEQLLPAVTEQMPELSRALTEQLKIYPTGKIISVNDLVEPLVKDLYYVPRSDSIWEHSKARFLNGALIRWGARALTAAVQQALVEKLEQVGQVIKGNLASGQASSDAIVKVGTDVITKFTTDTAKEIDFTQLEKTFPVMLVDALKNNINNYFNSIYTTILISILGMLLLIVGEIQYYRRHLQKPVEKNVANPLN
jgi:hypothetical protein